MIIIGSFIFWLLMLLFKFIYKKYLFFRIFRSKKRKTIFKNLNIYSTSSPPRVKEKIFFLDWEEPKNLVPVSTGKGRFVSPLGYPFP